jgi:hypothetical protein
MIPFVSSTVPEAALEEEFITLQEDMLLALLQDCEIDEDDRFTELLDFAELLPFISASLDKEASHSL